MEASIDQRIAHRVWIPAVIAVLLSIASAFSYFGYVGQGIIVGALLGLPGRESDVAIAQHWATYWLVASLCCLTGSIVRACVADLFRRVSFVSVHRTLRRGFDPLLSPDRVHRVCDVVNHHGITPTLSSLTRCPRHFP